MTGDVEGSGGDSAERGGGWWAVEGHAGNRKRRFEGGDSNPQRFGLTIFFFSQSPQFRFMTL